MQCFAPQGELGPNRDRYGLKKGYAVLLHSSGKVQKLPAQVILMWFPFRYGAFSHYLGAGAC